MEIRQKKEKMVGTYVFIYLFSNYSRMVEMKRLFFLLYESFFFALLFNKLICFNSEKGFC
ncbi:MAG: hypothetical protein COT84_04870 [Chlamydiae bacterium CG10_big_fil_rev_8_21_14_0_10_35_9]|nr:MAG: hypothetical protein COT84_04870 [Chlamydiae bacterium CG10_big_fil_rev_8_21_14_0_10_35_9]